MFENIKEREEYQKFTKPAEVHKAVNTLRGIVSGIATDTKVTGSEMEELIHWCSVHSHLRDWHPFSEILPVVENACEDGIITEEESKDCLLYTSDAADD